jgi:hypothetical protein
VASGGLLGVALGLWFVYELIRKARQRLRRADQFGRAACCGALAGLSGIAVHSFVDYGLHVSINALIFMVLIVIATAHPIQVMSHGGTETQRKDEKVKAHDLNLL